jgi:hypothetical protein
MSAIVNISARGAECERSPTERNASPVLILQLPKTLRGSNLQLALRSWTDRNSAGGNYYEHENVDFRDRFNFSCIVLAGGGKSGQDVCDSTRLQFGSKSKTSQNRCRQGRILQMQGRSEIIRRRVLTGINCLLLGRSFFLAAYSFTDFAEAPV